MKNWSTNKRWKKELQKGSLKFISFREYFSFLFCMEFVCFFFCWQNLRADEITKKKKKKRRNMRRRWRENERIECTLRFGAWGRIGKKAEKRIRMLRVVNSSWWILMFLCAYYLTYAWVLHKLWEFQSKSSFFYVIWP